MNQEKLQARIAARKSSEAAIQLLNESVEGDPVHFRSIVSEYARSNLPVDPKTGPMAEIEAKRFEKELMPFGEFKGTEIGSVPIERLDWYVKANEEFNVNLVRYLKWINGS